MAIAEEELIHAEDFFAADLLDVVASLDGEERTRFFRDLSDGFDAAADNKDFRKVVRVVKEWRREITSRHEPLMDDSEWGPGLVDIAKRAKADPLSGTALDDYLKEVEASPK